MTATGWRPRVWPSTPRAVSDENTIQNLMPNKFERRGRARMRWNHTRHTALGRTRQISPAPNPPWKVTRPPDGAWMPAHVPVGRNVCCQTFSMLHKTRLPSRRLAPDPARYNFVFCTLSYVCHTHLSA